MSQNTVDFSDNPNGPELMDDYLAKEQENRLTINSGIQRPSYAKAGTAWINNSTNPWELYVYDGSEDVLIGTIDTTNHDFISSNFEDVVNLTTNQTVAGVKTFSSNPLVPTPSSSDNSSKAANTSFVASVASGLQTQINNSVKTTGNQNIAGVKTFMNVPIFYGGVSATNEGGEIRFSPVNGNSSFKAGILDVFGYTNDETTHCIRVRMADVDGLRVYADGHASLPTSPATSDNSTKVATTAYVNNRVQLVSSLPASPTDGVLYCIAES